MPSHLAVRCLALFERLVIRLREHYAALTDGASRRRNLLLAGMVPVFCGVAAFAVAPLNPGDDGIAIRQVELELGAVPIVDAIVPLDTASQPFVHEERIRRGDTLGVLLTRLQVSDPAAEAFVRSNAPARALYQLRPGRVIQAATDADGTLEWLRYLRVPGDAGLGTDSDASPGSALVLERTASGFWLHQDSALRPRHLELRSARIDTSLFAATDREGIPDSIATQIADVFSGEIDFYRDLRRGDTLRVAYEMIDAGGDVMIAGRVMAVEFVNAGRTHQAVWYQDGASSGYYGFNGESLKRAFLRTPLAFTRISSGFGGRLHPILNTWRWHTGVDYAAPTGTPVRSTSDGVVEVAGVQTGYGNVVIIRHAGGFSTVYGHLSAFAPGMHPGVRVSQGQFIGRVGMTGWATGPHLHYEFRINGTARDPLRVVLPPAEPIAPAQLAAFRERTAAQDRVIALLRDIETVPASPPAADGA
jgi:murein DD-endopeptidase MepM/ murein hydrolase activator NlpD